MRVVFVGPPGSGKGTQAKLLQERHGLAYIGTGDILREEVRLGTPLGKQVESCLAAGRLVSDQLVNELIAGRFRRSDRPERFIMDGYPRTVAQAAMLDTILKEHDLPLRAVVHFQIDEDAVAHRLLGRARQDDSEQTVRQRLRIFRETTPDLLRYYRQQGLLHEVAAEDSIENLYDKISRILQVSAST